MPLQIVNPLEIPNWDDLVLATGKGSFFHSSAWARVLHESYGYKPVYFTYRENGNMLGLMPFMEVDSCLTGKRGVSLPFSDYCQPLCNSKEDFQRMVLGVKKYAKEAGWRYIEWRDAGSFLGEEKDCSRYYVHSLRLEGELESILAGFRGSTRRNIKKALRTGVSVDILNSYDSVKEYYRMHRITRKEHGFPPQPFKFFEKIFEHVVATMKGIVVLASYRGVPVAGAIFLYSGDEAIFKYGASDSKCHYLRPNNLVMWEAIKWCKANSFMKLNFGRTRFEDRGLMQFKNGWGTKREVVKYHQYKPGKGAFMRDPGRLEKAGRFMGRLPSPIFNLVGALFYRHVG